MHCSIFKAGIVSGISMLCGCSSLLYAPTDLLYVPPEKIGLKYESVELKSDGHSIQAWLFTHPEKIRAKGLILFFHGNGQNRSAHYLALKWLLDEGYDYFIFDYQGYGDSSGKPTPKGTVHDGLAALEWLVSESHLPKYAKVPLMVYAQSLGGPIALRSLIEFNTADHSKELKKIQTVILESTFLSYQEAGSNLLSHAWVTYLFQPLAYLLLSDQWTAKNQLSKLPDARFIVVHGEKDTLVSPKLGRELFEALPNPKIWLPVPEGGHIDAFSREEGRYRQALLDLLESDRKN